MKTRMFKTLAVAVAMCSMCMPFAANAAVDSTGDYSTPADEACNVYVSAESGWTVTIPKRIALDVESGTGSADYEVSVVGNIDSTHKITVEPDASFNMTQGDESLPATVTQTVTDFSGKELTLETPMKASGAVNATGFRAGEYDGNFDFHIAEKTA